jgi:glycosyltransferase involved in cell wall biosynthesis
MKRTSLGPPRETTIRVLHILEATLGGTLRYMENVATATEGSEIVSAFAYGMARADSRLHPFLDSVTKMGWTSYATDMRREISVRNDLTSFRQLRRAVLHFAPDVIHCHSSKAGALGRAVAALQARMPARVYSPHALAAHLGRKYLRIEKLLSRHTDRFIAVSDSERTEILGFSLAKEQAVSVVYPTVDCEHFAPSSRDNARRLLGLGAAPLVVSIGRLTAQKNPAAFIEIIHRLHERRPDIQAIWVGSGTDDLDFPAMVKAARMEAVIRIVEWQHDVRQYIAAADILLSTSKFESFGYVAAEALSMNRGLGYHGHTGYYAWRATGVSLSCRPTRAGHSTYPSAPSVSRPGRGRRNPGTCRDSEPFQQAAHAGESGGSLPQDPRSFTPTQCLTLIEE